jgi:hypothetical protein
MTLLSFWALKASTLAGPAGVLDKSGEWLVSWFNMKNRQQGDIPGPENGRTTSPALPAITVIIVESSSQRSCNCG